MKISKNDLRGLGDLQHVYNWDIVFSGSSKSASILSNISDKLSLYCSTSVLPTRTQELIEIEQHGHTIKRLGKTTYDGEISLTFVDDTSPLVTEAFREIENLMWSSGIDGNGTQESDRDIRFTTNMTLYDNNDVKTQSYTLYDCRLTTFTPGGELSSENEILRPEATLAYDWFDWTGGRG